MNRHTQLPEFINSGNGLSAVTDGRGVMHKERGEEKGKSPHTPQKEKEGQKEISAASDSVFACGRARGRKAETETVDFHPEMKAETVRRAVEIRPNVSIVVTPEMILDGYRRNGHRNDPVAVAMFALGIPRSSGMRRNGIPYTNAGLLRWLIPQVGGEDAFRQIVYQQWRENAIDGEPRSRAAAFMAKLYAVRDELKGGAA